MDLSRVFGDGATFAPGTNPAANVFSPPAAAPAVVTAPQLQQAYEAGLHVRDNIGAVQSQSERLSQHVKSLVRSIEATRQAYDQIISERDQLRNRLVSAEGRLGEVQKVVQRYTNVQEPVVASDGYTYERAVIQQYLEECEKNNVTPLSQLTKGELSQTLIPNQSLKKLVELLKTVKPQAVPPPSSTTAPRKPDDAAARNDGNAAAAARKTNGAANPPQEGRLHPCVRVYGFCNYKDMCTYAMYPYDACLSHLKGKCRFGSQCHELHVDYRGKLQGNGPSMPSPTMQQMRPNDGATMGAPKTGMAPRDDIKK